MEVVMNCGRKSIESTSLGLFMCNPTLLFVLSCLAPLSTWRLNVMNCSTSPVLMRYTYVQRSLVL